MTTKTARPLAVAAKIALVTVVLIVVQGIGARFVPASQDPAPQPSAGFLAIVVGVALLQTIALAYPVIRSRWHGWRLVATVFVLYFGTVTFLSQMESLVYLNAHMPPGMQAGIVWMGLFNALVFAPIIVLVLGRWRRTAGDDASLRLRMPATTWAWKLLAGAALFVLLYYLFGYYVAWKNPALRAYYGGTDPGSFLAQMSGTVRGTPWMLPLQFVRGILCVLVALPVIRMMQGRWWEAGLAVALLFTVPAAYLLFPNPVMPEEVRLTHLVETAPYLFLFGWCVAWLFTRDSPQTRPPDPRMATSNA